MRLVTAANVTLDVGRIERRVVDQYIAQNPPPDPPQIEVSVLGGVTELVDDLDNPAFRSRLAAYNLRMARDEFQMIAAAVTVISPANWEEAPDVMELADLGLVIRNITDYLRYIALSEPEDLTHVIEEVLYQSTVTPRGIAEAERTFSIIYRGTELSHYPNPPGDMRISALYQARLAATEQHYRWEQFCALSGPEQSAIVAQYQCSMKLQWLSQREQEQRMRHSSARIKR